LVFVASPPASIPGGTTSDIDIPSDGKHSGEVTGSITLVGLKKEIGIPIRTKIGGGIGHTQTGIFDSSGEKSGIGPTAIGTAAIFN
jgi:hypothetical protein